MPGGVDERRDAGSQAGRVEPFPDIGAQALGGDRVEVLSAGSAPKDQINPIAIQAMAEDGIDIAGNQPKILTTDAVRDSDAVITMGCGDACPVFPGKSYRDWALTDPAGKGVEAVRPIRDDIRAHVTTLMARLRHDFPDTGCMSDTVGTGDTLVTVDGRG